MIEITETGAITKLADRCKKCKHVDVCDNKRMEACGHIKSKATEIRAPIAQVNAQPILRETITINTGENALGRVEIYKDDLIEKIQENIYKSCGFNKLNR